MRFRGPQECLFPVRVVEVDIHQLEALGAQLRDGCMDVVRLERDVVEALAARVEELREKALAEGFQQLDLAAARKPELDQRQVPSASPPIRYSPPRASR